MISYDLIKIGYNGNDFQGTLLNNVFIIFMSVHIFVCNIFFGYVEDFAVENKKMHNSGVSIEYNFQKCRYGTGLVASEAAMISFTSFERNPVINETSFANRQ